MAILTAFNGCEAAFWATLAVVIAIRYRHSIAGLRRISLIASALLVLFAISDVIEMYTGAWWKPLSLLLLKGFCLVGLVCCTCRLVREAPGSKETGSK